jgi:hypothetical protein
VAKKRFGSKKNPRRRVKSRQIFAISTMMRSCAGSRYSYGIKPEYQASIGGRNRTSKKATSAWLATRSTNKVNRIQMRAVTGSSGRHFFSYILL